MLSYEELIKKISQNEAKLSSVMIQLEQVRVKREECAAKCRAELGTDDEATLMELKDSIQAEIARLEKEVDV
jgi:hypothetical protein